MRRIESLGRAAAIVVALAVAALAAAAVAHAGAGPAADDAPLAPLVPAYPTATFKASFYGIQRYRQVTTSRENPATECHTQQGRGTDTGWTTVRFESRRPVLLTVVLPPAGLPLLTFAGADGTFPVRATATVTMGGSTGMELSRCVGGSHEWDPTPQPLGGCGSKPLPDAGGSIAVQRPGELTFFGGPRTPLPGDLFPHCAYGEHQYGLYQATGRFSAADLVRSKLGKFELILRGSGREAADSTSPTGIGGYIRTRKTTVYVTLVRARSGAAT
jgi:hypothetical protein